MQTSVTQDVVTQVTEAVVVLFLYTPAPLVVQVGCHRHSPVFAAFFAELGPRGTASFCMWQESNAFLLAHQGVHSSTGSHESVCATRSYATAVCRLPEATGRKGSLSPLMTFSNCA